MVSLALTMVFSGPAQAQAGNEQMMNLVLQVQQLQDEIRALRGQVEQQSFEIEELKNRQRDQYLDLDRRIGAASGPAGADPRPVTVNPPAATASGASPPVRNRSPEMAPSIGPTLGGGVAGSGAVSTSGAADLPDVREAIDTPSEVVALDTPQVASRAVQATPELEQAAYDEAFQSLKDLRYADAAEQFQAFLASYPDSELADNAQYWLGESYYVTRNYDIALEAFEALARDYPDSSKSGDGLLKIGFTHYELKQYDQARAALEQVQQRYPNSTLSRLAESRLRSMRVAGHY